MKAFYSILVEDDLYDKIDPDLKKEELKVFAFLGAMLMVLSLISGISIFLYITVIFKNIYIALSVALVTILIIYNLIRLLLVTSISAYHTKLGNYQLNHTMIYEDVKLEGNEEADNLKILETVNQKKENLRKLSAATGLYRIDFAHKINFIVKLIILSFLAIVFATGVELLIFSIQLNESFEAIRNLFANNPDSWIVKEALKADDNYIILNTNSILFAINMLSSGLGWFKLIFDAVFVLLFTIPTVIVHKSSRIYDSSYVRELALHELSITYYHHLHKERFCKKIEEEILNYDLSYLLDSSNTKNGR